MLKQKPKQLSPSDVTSLGIVMPVKLEQFWKQPFTIDVTVVGKICESADMITKDLPVTANIMPGDIFAVFSTGAYNYSMSSNYNQLPKPAVVFTYEGESRVVVRRQTFDDLILFDEE